MLYGLVGGVQGFALAQNTLTQGLALDLLAWTAFLRDQSIYNEGADHLERKDH